jgi:hypothetical protein
MLMSVNPLAMPAVNVTRLENISGPLNISIAFLAWYFVAMNVLQLVSPLGERSLLYPSVIQNNLSALFISYLSYRDGLYSTFGKRIFWVPTEI